MIRLAILAMLVASTAAAEPTLTPGCDYDGWMCYDGFPALSKDRLKIVVATTRDNKVVFDFVSVATGKRLATKVVFDPSDPHHADVIARAQRSIVGFRSMDLIEQHDDVFIYRLGTLELTVDETPTYRVRRRRR